LDLERLKALYDAGLLTRGDLYARITELPSVDVQEVRRIFGAELVVGLSDWRRAIEGGATIFGGERDPSV
jgi:hypothetical protein